MDKDRFNDPEEVEKMSPNELDPRLWFDAFTAGVKDGGLRSTSTISLLVCYIIANINGKVTAENIIETVNEGMIANHFEITNAISKLKKSGVIAENEDGALTLHNIGYANIELVEKDLPFTIRENSIRICQKIIAKEKYQRENKTEITKVDNGYDVTLHISDKDIDFLTLTLHTNSVEQAELIKDKFITDPIKVYDTLIDAIFSN